MKPCNEWAGTRHKEGYGLVNTGNKQLLAHRVAFEKHYGYLPQEPMVVDHLCRNRLCVEPSHLQEVSRAENTRLGAVRKGPLPERCPKGHSEWKVRSNGYRRCNRCHIINESERRRRKRAA